ncbi:terminase large subunit [Rhodopseudomonas pseudopalustris]|uniref:Phage terminase-like protein, large subunit, contains N-terminal HTH domain n=1 Tax=Rhodopseudomonas pseudopalustris TaxID=1513892 RepID=A0A1H8VXP3_9BRAD|nr:terminase TerL endonuclease subunit [Rhodopseudomonas pseudopalustris]SEP20169.1 Phage terminase-like protein, large subunit, contains N-terminal HTH domain [Rhodopseudomonas pseudopalustris]
MMTKTYPHWIFDGSEIADPLGHGERAVQFLRALRHPKSTLPKRAFRLDEWQERIIRRIYGPRNEDGTRVVKTVVLVIARGNRKTSLAGALSLLHTIGPERVPGGENILAASDRKQAGYGFREAAGIVREDKRLVAATRIYDAHNSVKTIHFIRDGSFLEAISGDAGTQHGRTPAFVFADELHIWRNAELWKALKSAMVKSQGSLLVVATTSGRGQENIAFEIVDRARKVASGEIIDPTMLPILFETAADADWKDEALWYAANPGLALGYQDIEGLRQLAREGETSITARETFRQYNLNVWLDHSTDPFVDMQIYDRGGGALPDGLDGLPCWIGVDMSTTTDLTAVVACIRKDDDFVVLPHFFCPGDNLRARADRDGVPYPAWAAAGHLAPTPGNVIDYSAVEACIRGLNERFDVREIGFDPAYAQAVMGPLTDDGLPTATIRQGWVTQSPALNELERVILAGKLLHGGHPVLRWCFDNVAIHTDSAGNRTMHKGKSRDRVDGAVATWMAVSRAAASETRSFYDSDAFTEDMASF